MNFEKAKNAVKACIAGSVICCAADLLFVPEGSNMAAYLLLGSIIFAVLSIILIFNFCKCPYCGKRITVGLFAVKECPSCRRDLATGQRRKGKGGKRK